MDGCKTQMQHYAWIDGLKVFACFLVIMQHTLSSNWVAPFTNGEDISEFWIAVNAVFTLAKAGVPLFFMCSGAVMLQKWRSIREIWSHSIPNLLVPYVTWMLVYGIRDVFSLYESGNLTMRTGINAIAKAVLFGQYHTWFVAALVALYSITPFLHAIVSERGLEFYFLILAFAFTILTPYVDRYDSLTRVQSVIMDAKMMLVVGWPIYFLGGHFLANTKIRKWEIGGVSVVLIAAYIIALLKSTRAAVGAGGDTQLIYTEFSLLGFIIAFCIFRLFQLAFGSVSPCGRMSRGMRLLSGYGYAVYLVHPLLLGCVSWFAGNFILNYSP